MKLDYLENKVVLITGAAGTVGRALAERLAGHVKALRCLDHNESELFFVNERLKGMVSPQLGDIRDLERLRFAFHGADVVFHAAALKHVGLGEYNPFEVVQSNLVGLNNVIRASLDANIERLIFTSSDKAVNPTNVMGASKMMGERLVTAANEIRGDRRTRFAAVRFGNVIGSRGSVLPIFVRCLMRGEPLPITDLAMTRYVMTIREAAELVIEAGARMKAGEVYVTKMRALRIVDLAHATAEVLGKRCELVSTGVRPGEKTYEELISRDEMTRTLELERLLVVLPPPDSAPDVAPQSSAFPDVPRTVKDWNSSTDELMTRADIIAYLRGQRVIDTILEGL
jgi:UDP-N-acetylglucosamine 4,6-dehydratase/5-epimerase